MTCDAWDAKFMSVARLIASWSKHPDYKVGCVIADDSHNQLSGGYNGLPRGVDDSRILDQSTPSHLSCTVHAEANAVAAAARNGHSLNNSTAYVTMPPCSQCAALLIQAGVKRVVYCFHPMNKKWTESSIAATEIFWRVGVAIKEWTE